MRATFEVHSDRGVESTRSASEDNWKSAREAAEQDARLIRDICRRKVWIQEAKGE